MAPRYHEGICKNCSKPYRGRGKEFCSVACRQSWKNREANPAKTTEARAKISASRKGKPTTLGRILPKSQRKNISKALRGRKLSHAHKAAISKGVKRAGSIPPRNPHLVGPNHPNWKGGITRTKTVDMATPQYRKFRQQVFERDNYTCADCKKRGGYLNAHHIKPWASHPQLRYDPSNAVTLCRQCHSSRHRGVPKPQAADVRTLADRWSDHDEV